jgi:hypothetical protein
MRSFVLALLFGLFSTFVSILDMADLTFVSLTGSARFMGDAQKIWERAITAKGGRDRLYSISNMVSISTGKFKHGDRVVSTYNESLFDFAKNRSWIWNDQRPSVFGLTMAMHDGTAGKKYHVTLGGEPFRGLQGINPTARNTNGAGLIHYFLETKWNKPIVESVSDGKVGSRTVHVVKTSFLGQRSDFAFDIETFYLLRVVYYSDGVPNNQIRMSDYVEVNGLKMPSRITLEQLDGDMEYSVKTLMNVDYDESIFNKPPPFEAGPKAWLKK